MCRILGYLGAPVTLDELLYAPAFSLCRQAHAPRLQDPGRINADGWGVGWYDLTVRDEPARYRTVSPMWADRRFGDIAPLIRTDLLIAAVRNASPGAPIEETGSSPFVSGRYLFTHNGFVDGFREGLGVQLRRGLSERRDAEILGAADSEVLFAMVLDRLDKGASMTDALADVIGEVREVTTGRFNLLMTDGHQMVASCDGNTLFTRQRDQADAGALVIASEPFDDDPDWFAVDDRTIVRCARGDTLTSTPL